MRSHVRALSVGACLSIMLFGGSTPSVSGKDLGGGFTDHGVAVPVSNHRGTVATVDGNGRDVVLSWLNDHRGGYELLLIDAASGRVEEYPIPFPPGDHPFASILSGANRFYTHFNGRFVEFDPSKRAFSFCAKTKPQMAMSMTEDDAGVIWSATYPNCGLISFDPKSREFTDHGYLNDENWAQYPRSVAADDAGWIYIGVGSTLGQIIAYDPGTRHSLALLPREGRTHGYSAVYRDMDGRVYAIPIADKPAGLVMLREGKMSPVPKDYRARRKPYIAGSQGLFQKTFPDGRSVGVYDLAERRFGIKDPKAEKATEFNIDYKSEGAHIMGVAAAPDGTICGGTAFPMRAFTYDPRADKWSHRPAFGQWNTLACQGGRVFVGAYSSGSLLEWDPSKPWVPKGAGATEANPVQRIHCAPTIIRPHALLADPDGRMVAMGGTPEYGTTGGGLLLWDRQTREGHVLTHEQVIPQHSTFSLVALGGDRLLGGTTTSPGTGGEKKADQAELYLMDMRSRVVQWHAALFPGAQGYTALFNGPRHLVYGIVDQHRFFVFDPTEKKVIHEASTEKEFGPTVSHQGPRVFVSRGADEVFVLFAKGIGRIEPSTFEIKWIARSPVPLGAGGDCLDGRIYFAGGSHLYSLKLP